MSYTFYILRCRDNSLYCGQTKNLQKRIEEHNSGKKISAKYTRSRKPVALVYSEDYGTLTEALKRESEVKKWSKKRKESLVSSTPGF